MFIPAAGIAIFMQFTNTINSGGYVCVSAFSFAFVSNTLRFSRKFDTVEVSRPLRILEH